MKKIFGFILFVYVMIYLMNTISYAQTCVPQGTLEQRRQAYDGWVGFLYEDDLIGYDPANGPQYKVGLAIHIITDSNGNTSLSNQELQSALQYLINIFNQQVNIIFTVIKRDTIANDDYLITSIGEEDTISMNYNVPHAINIYFTEQFDDNISGRSTYSPVQQDWYNMFVPDCARLGQCIFVKNSRANTPTLPHEVGHYFDLFHTYEKNLLGMGNDWTNGDLVPDTPTAVPGHSYNCQNEPEKARNFMAFPPVPTDCREEFSAIQIKKNTLCSGKPSGGPFS